jgi:hypothetical protein
MPHQASVDIEAGADQVWAVLVDIGDWPSWNPTVTLVRPLQDGLGDWAAPPRSANPSSPRRPGGSAGSNRESVSSGLIPSTAYHQRHRRQQSDRPKPRLVIPISRCTTSTTRSPTDQQPGARYSRLDDIMTISSCESKSEGGPTLGITGHETENVKILTTVLSQPGGGRDSGEDAK